MKHFIFLLTFCLGTTAIAQSLYIETGKTNSAFEFTNSQGVELENLQSATQSYVQAGYKHNVGVEGLDLGLGLSYNSYGALGSDDALSNFFEYDTDYLGINLTLNYDLFEFQKVNFYLLLGGSVELLLQGTQVTNGQVINLKKVEEFNNNAFFYRGGAGFSYPISDTTKMYAQYSYGMSNALNDDGNNSAEELKFISHMVGVGIQIDFGGTSEDTDDDTVTED